ncbi:hypothetical protein NIIDNTM18_16660 [Mycolicibacterium litorale]|uniref:Uncharacterized protein n=1 Tax=Mycolicibacterium litorale TaxID=758802 RepID=A0A6S6P7Z1_9MYCO|nr:hypothetical protein [Mycolicibacterium litorale]BCI52388.1 hypothetical protein NIIDNTM18_16660 [Mycolicibacterium litorale]
MTAKWDVVVVEPFEHGIENPSDEDLQSTTIDAADEADARQMYADKLQALGDHRHTAVQLRRDGRIIERWPA